MRGLFQRGSFGGDCHSGQVASVSVNSCSKNLTKD